MSEAVDVIVVGGGVTGCAVAWSLARAGVERVLVLERGEVGSQTTSRAASVLTRVAGSAAKSALLQETWPAIAALEDELGESLGVREVGCLHVAVSEGSQAELEAYVRLVEEVGDPHEDWTVEDARARVPWLSPGEDARCLFLPRTGYVDSHLLATAYARAARARGVELRVGVEVTGLTREGDRVVGVETTSGAVTAPWVVNCAGPWAGLLAAEAGWHLPMAPVRSQYWITEVREEFDPSQPVVLLPDVPAYTRGEVGGLLFGLRAGSSPARDPRELPKDLGGMRFAEDPEGWDTLAECGEAFARSFPLLNSVQLKHYVSGPSTYTPDGHFVIGALPEVEGFLVASGCCGLGVAASGGVGRAISELVLGAAGGLDLEPFRPDRFGRVDAFEAAWLERCAKARSQKTAC